MLSSKSEYLQEASNTVYKMISDREIRERCQAREDYLYWEHIKNNRHAKALAEREAVIQTQREELRNKETELLHKDSVIQTQEAELAHKDAQLAAALAKIAELEAKQK